MNINLHIEHIVLDGSGFGSLQPEDLRQAMESQLKDHFTNNGLKHDSGFTTDRMTAPTVGIQTLAADVASSVSSIL